MYSKVASEEVCVRESLSLERRPVDGMYVCMVNAYYDEWGNQIKSIRRET